MNLRCMYCQTMFGISRDVMLIGLQTMDAEKLSHYDIYCPKCRRANRVERNKLELANPNWQEKVKAMAKEAAKAGKERAAAETAETAPKAATAPAKKKAPAKSKAKPKTTAAKSTPKSKAKAATAKKSTATKPKVK